MGGAENKRVLAAVVTYNRLNLLKRCINHLKQQTLLPDILVINNSSTDGTELFLEAESIPYITQNNSGSSGGWFTSIAEAANKNYDYVWLMDDDGFPDDSALETLINAMDENTACASSVVIKETNPDEFVFGFPKLNKHGNPVIFNLRRKFYKLSDLYPEYITYPFAHFFNGALINLKIIHVVGNVDLRYFMYGDEVDYFFRLKNAGKVITVFEAKHNHPDVNKRSIEEKRVYYYIRNTIILNNMYFDNAQIRNFLTIWVALYRILRRNGIVKCLRYLFGKEAKYFYPAIKDGYTKNFIKRF